MKRPQRTIEGGSQLEQLTLDLRPPLETAVVFEPQLDLFDDQPVFIGIDFASGEDETVAYMAMQIAEEEDRRFLQMIESLSMRMLVPIELVRGRPLQPSDLSRPRT